MGRDLEPTRSFGSVIFGMGVKALAGDAGFPKAVGESYALFRRMMVAWGEPSVDGGWTAR